MTELEALREYALAATRAITGLAGGGSEMFDRKIGEVYTADLARCINKVRDREATSHKLLVEAIKDKREALAKVQS